MRRLRVSRLQALNMQALSGIYSWAGFNSDLIKARHITMTALSGLFQISGKNATLARQTRYLGALSGSFSWGGNAATLTATSSQPQSPLDISTFTLTSTAGSATTPFAIGFAFKQGDISATDQVQITGASANAQVTPKNYWPDGSMKFAIIAGTANVPASTPTTVTVRRSTASSGTALTTVDLKNAMAGQTCSISYGVYGAVSWGSTEFDSPFQTWVSGHRMSSWLYRKPIGSDAHLVGWIEVRLFAGGAVEVVPWIENGYLLVSGCGEKNGVATFTLGSTSRFSANLNLLNHQRAILASGTVYSHWLGTDPGLSWAHDTTYLRSTKLVPNWVSTPSSADLNARFTNYTPVGQGEWPDNMTDVGGHPYIGLYPIWDAMYVTSNGDIRAWRSTICHAMLAGRYGTHYRDENTNLPFRISDPAYATLQFTNPGSMFGVNGVGDDDPSVRIPAPSGAAPPLHVSSHQPSIAAMAYMLTGRRYFVDEMQFIMGTNYARIPVSSRQQSTFIINSANSAVDEPRGAGWMMRCLAHAATFTPDGEAAQADFRTAIDNNINWYYNRYANNGDPIGFVQPPEYSHSPQWWWRGWMDDFFSAGWQLMRDAKVYGTANESKLTAFMNHKWSAVVGRTGSGAAGTYNYRYCTQYEFAFRPTTSTDWSTGPWFSGWGEVATTMGIPAADGGNSLFPPGYQDGAQGGLTNGFLGNMLQPLVDAVDGGYPGAADGWNRITSSPDYINNATYFGGYPNWGVRPRAISVLAQTAAALSPGYSIKLNTGNLASILRFGSDTSPFIKYSCSGCYDPTRQQVRFIGKTESPNQYHGLVYNESANTWSNTSWVMWDSANYSGHGYDHNTIDPQTGTTYFRLYNSGTVKVWNGSWSTLSPDFGGSSASNPAGGLTWFPGVGLMFSDGYALKKYAAGAWTDVAATGGGSYHDWSEYNSSAGVLIYGGGNGPTQMRKYTGSGAPVSIANPPEAFGAHEQIQGPCITDPSSDRLVGRNNSTGNWYEYDIGRDKWNTLTKSTGSGATQQLGTPNLILGWSTSPAIAVPIPQHGVQMWIQYPDQVWLYKHAPTQPATFTTTFSANENPISEGGTWAHAANVWQRIQTTGGNAIAAAYTENYDDAYAYLQNWSGGNNYEVIATIYHPSGADGETEILLRVSDSTTQVHAYECLHNTGGHWQIVRWNGNLQDFTPLAGGDGPSGSVNGSQIRATIVGNAISFYWRLNSGNSWTLLGTASDSTYATGKPGMAFYVHALDGNRTTVGMQDYTVTQI